MKEKNKKLIKIIIILIAILLVTKSVLFIATERGYLSDKYNIKLPKPISEKKIFTIKFRDGQVFSMLKYNSEHKKQIIKEYKFKKINDNTIEEIKKMVERFHISLDKENEKKFAATIKKDELIKYGNYFLIKHRPYDRFVILIFYKNTLYVCTEI